jgi:HAD superfamily hydrolase (TIGR01509 family)
MTTSRDEARQDEGPILLLDAMDTLVVDPFFTVFPRFFGCSLPELFKDKDPTAWIRFEKNEIDEATWAEITFSDRRDFDLAALKAEMFGAYRLIDGIEALLDDLKAADVPMHILSNYPHWYRDLDERLHLSRWLPWTFVSWHLGMRKPDPAIFQHAADHLEVAPERLIFVDDRERNCEGARSIGVDAIVFESADQLRTALGARGVLAS